MTWTLYQLYLLGNIGDGARMVIMVLFIFFGLFIFSFSLAHAIFGEGRIEEDKKKGIIIALKTFAKIWFAIFLFFGTICIAVPSKTEVYAIFGAGATLDYLQNNDKAKQLPDKAIEALYKYLDQATEEKQHDRD